MPVKNLTHGTLVIKDGTSPTPFEITVGCSKGDLKWDRAKEAKLVQNRGRNYEMTQGIETAMPVSWTMVHERLLSKNGAVDPTVYEALHQEGNAENWKSVFTNKINSPFGADLEFTVADVEGADSDGENEVYIFRGFTIDKHGFSEGSDANELSISGKCLATKPEIEGNPTE